MRFGALLKSRNAIILRVYASASLTGLLSSITL